jgi:hypothetical protein
MTKKLKIRCRSGWDKSQKTFICFKFYIHLWRLYLLSLVFKDFFLVYMMYTVKSVNDRWMMISKESGKQISWPTCDTIPVLAWKGWINPRETSVRITEFPAEIRKEQIPNSNQEPYRCSHLLTLVPRLRIILPWRWRQYVPPKRRFTRDLHPRKRHSS